MKNILIFGAGRSSKYLIEYLVEHARLYNCKIRIADLQLDEKRSTPEVEYSVLNVRDEFARDAEVKIADLVISMLPARFHKLVAQSCLKFSKNLLTASYETNELKAFEEEVNEKGLFFLNECGLDPGLDHMSAMKMIDEIKSSGNEMLSFESFTGGLVAPESDNNPWNYKFSWNPRNVVLAGQGGPAQFIQNGKIKYIPYNRLFRRTEMIDLGKYGMFEGYANRDSLKYLDRYSLQGIPTIFRGTLRRPGFSKAWNVFVQLGATDDSYVMEGTENMTYREFINSFLPYHPSDSVELKLFHYLNIPQDSEIVYKLKWLGIFENTPIGLKRATPAQVLEHILKQKWQLRSEDKDMIVMWHKFIFRNKHTGQTLKKTSSLVVTGENSDDTAMALTVGLPLAVAAKLVLTDQLKLKGMFIPNRKEIYEPILDELENYGITFYESEVVEEETSVCY
ncbi:saccharopine dehydrogenase C-terminal domain-containing protein [Maribellus sediminis]|uniref:saccharopine dehydrogenase C-terminal domain-containing protein n=1 Tax=Maribellus sediminis TaxID=2696285 RepID=UPI00142FDD9E|nr:saccharopine dehydrogenase C-terminal domain-containing protein [Maribellus sediminis]